MMEGYDYSASASIAANAVIESRGVLAWRTERAPPAFGSALMAPPRLFTDDDGTEVEVA